MCLTLYWMSSFGFMLFVCLCVCLFVCLFVFPFVFAFFGFVSLGVCCSLFVLFGRFSTQEEINKPDLLSYLCCVQSECKPNAPTGQPDTSRQSISSVLSSA